MRLIITAAGGQSKWNNHLGVPSHLAPLTAHSGEPLIHRTVRQALALTDDVHMTVPPGDNRYRLPGVVAHERAAADFENEYLACRDLWSESGRTVMLLGDVYFTDRALRVIKKTPARPHSYRVYGRFRRSTVTGTPYGEIFAASWWPNCHRMLDRHLERIVRTFHSGESNRRDGWTLLRSIQGTPLNSHRVMQPWFIEINDWTDDIDFPADYERHPATRGTTK